MYCTYPNTFYILMYAAASFQKILITILGKQVHIHFIVKLLNIIE